MKKHLLYFGKSSSFKRHVFNEDGLVADFLNQFSEFNYLESDSVMPEKFTDELFFARYSIVVDGVSCNLLKVYRFAQASDSTRISGSTIGIAVLSEGEIVINKHNLTLLSDHLSLFEKEALNGRKFKSPDFLEQVKSISTHKLLTEIQTNIRSGGQTTNGSKKALYIVSDSLRDYVLSKIDNTISRIYLSTNQDILVDHLSDWKNKDLSIYRERNDHFTDEMEILRSKEEERARREKEERDRLHRERGRSQSGLPKEDNDGDDHEGGNDHKLKNDIHRLKSQKKQLTLLAVILALLLLFSWVIPSGDDSLPPPTQQTNKNSGTQDTEKTIDHFLKFLVDYSKFRVDQQYNVLNTFTAIRDYNFSQAQSKQELIEEVYEKFKVSLKDFKIDSAKIEKHVLELKNKLSSK